MKALIGSQGTIGQSLLDQMSFDAVFNSDNINELADYQIDQCIIAAPSGNRLAINRSPSGDAADVNAIVSAVSRARPRSIVLISSIDVVAAPNSTYGRNRQQLEIQCQAVAPTAIFRLSTLIGARIKKNILHDLKHNLFLDCIDAGAVLQYCLLADLARLIHSAAVDSQLNVVSEPVSNAEVLARFRPELTCGVSEHSVHYDHRPYVYSKQQIFESMAEYLK